MRAKVQITGEFLGPDFVKGWGDHSGSYTILNSTTAVLSFQGGIDPDITYTQTLTGTGFGITSDGRYTGTVTSFVGVNDNDPSNYWTFTNIKAPLNIMNTQAMSLDFTELLVTPQAYRFIGDSYDDFYIMSSFGDIAYGKKGDDSFFGLSGNDKLNGGPGKDLLVGDQGNDILRGGSGSDKMLGGIGADEIHGKTGADTARGGGDDDTIYGNQGNDKLLGQGGSDTVGGGSGNDTIFGGADSDLLKGGRGHDDLDGGRDEDTIYGGRGNDTITAGPKDDVAGDKMYGGSGDDMITGYKGVDALYGGQGEDRLYGGDNLDDLFGGSGDDILVGGRGSDKIVGGKGDDRLSGNKAGSVVLDDGLNVFLFANDFGDDVITDFHIKFDTIALAGVTEDDVTVTTRGDDVKIVVATDAGDQSILVEGVAGQFNADADIFYP